MAETTDEDIWQNLVDQLHRTYIADFFPEFPALLLATPPLEKLTPDALEQALSLQQKQPIRQDLSALVTDAELTDAVSDLAEGVPREFRFQVEPMLSRAAVLLDRALVDRAAYFQLDLERFTLGLQLIEFALSDSLIRIDEAAGVNERDYKIARFTRLAEAASSEGIDCAISRTADLISPAEDPPLEHLLEEGRIARMATIASAAARNTAKPYIKPNESAWMRDWPAYEGRRGQVNPDELASHLQYRMTTHQLELARQQVLISLDQLRSQRAAKEERLELLEWDETLSGKTKVTRACKNQVARLIHRLKAASIVKPCGTLNYGERIRPIERRYRADFTEAYALLSRVREGFSAVYGIDTDPLPQAGPECLDRTVEWLRAASSILGRIAFLEKPQIRTISLATKPEFAGGIDAGWKFELTPSDFPNQRWIRLRGIQAYALDDMGEIPYPVVVSPPAIGEMLKKSDRGKQAQPLGPQRLEAGPRTWPRDTTSIALAAWHNGSPIGEWTVSLEEGSKDRAKQQKLRDIQVDLYLVVQDAPS